MMKNFVKDTGLAIGAQAILVGITWLVVFLFHLPQDTWLLQWLRIYAPTTLLIMILFMLYTKSRNLVIALVLGFLLGASLYGAVFSFILNSYRKYKSPTLVSKNIPDETGSSENISK